MLALAALLEGWQPDRLLAARVGANRRRRSHYQRVVQS